MNGKYVFKRSVIALSPNMMPFKGIDQLGRDAQTVSGLADTAFQHIAYAQFLCHLLSLGRLPLISKRGIASDHKQMWDLG